MRFSVFTLLLSFFFVSQCFAQLIWTEPPLPYTNDPVTIFFDATQGTGGLADCNCDVYLHTGVITDQSMNPSDWKHVVTSWGVANDDWKMELVAGQDNVYSYDIAPDIRTYYGVPMNETIEQMAFVFRNANGSLEGKDVGGADIFYDVFEGNGFSASILTPSLNTIIASQGEFIEISAGATEESNLTLTDNGTPLIQTTGTSLEYTIDVQDIGTNVVIFTANNGTEEIKDSFTYAVPLPVVVEELPANTKNGINYINDSTVVLSLYAPGKQYVFLLGDFNDWIVDTDYQLKNTPDGNTWWIEITGLNPGEEYAFQYLVEGVFFQIPDPYSEKILDQWHDGFIPESVYPDLKPFPFGRAIHIVSVLQTAQEEYQWEDDDFIPPEKSKLVIYELLMRDFLESHSYVDLLDTLDYLERLGVNAIELMPVNEFEGNQSWGYNPSFHGALDKYYGTPGAFKDFINEAHSRGIAVILDVVYNHAFSQSTLARLYWDDQNNRPAPDNPWLNPIPKHPYNVGYDFNHESQVTKEYVKQTLELWIEKYHIDGFRFDLSKGFTQNQSNDDSQFSAYDASRIAILKDYADFIWDIDPDIYVILEHFATNAEEKELAEYGMMIWGNSNHDYNEASMGYSSNFSWVSHKQRDWNVPHVVGYMESHDEERQMYKNSQWGNSSGNYDVTDLNTGLSRVELTSTFFFPIPGPKMIWAFGELGYDFSINRCTNGTINPDCRLDPKPIRWDYQENENRVQVFNVMKQLIHLKKNEEVFSTNDFNYVLSGSLKKIHLNGDDTNVTIIGNFGVTTGSINPQFQHTGWWHEYFSGDSILVNNVNANISLEAGEYRLYSSQDLATSDKNPVDYTFSTNVFPNPANGHFTVTLDIENSEALKVDLFDISGKRVAQLYNGTYLEGQNLIFDLDQHNGIYFLRFVADKRIAFAKLIIQN